MKMVAVRAGLSEPITVIVLRLGTSLVASDPISSPDPRCVEVPFLVALGNREHAWQCLDCACSVTIALANGRCPCRSWSSAVLRTNVHQQAVVVCVLIGTPGLRPRKGAVAPAAAL